jgi:hypothetical protein
VVNLTQYNALFHEDITKANLDAELEPELEGDTITAD